MAELYDSEGNLVEGALTADEIKAIQESATKASQEAAELKERLAKVENKEFNFKKLRDMTEEDRKSLTAREMEVIQRQEALENQTKGFVETQIKTYKDDALDALAAGNDELRKRTEFHFARFKDEATTREQIRANMRDAFRVAQAELSAGADPFAAAMAFGGGGAAPAPKSDTKEFSANELDLAKKFGISTDDLKKYNH